MRLVCQDFSRNPESDTSTWTIERHHHDDQTCTLLLVNLNTRIVSATIREDRAHGSETIGIFVKDHRAFILDKLKDSL